MNGSDRIESGILFEIYGGLLTEKKRDMMELYHDEDLSLSEIAEARGISRAAVHDALRSARESIDNYESKLGILKRTRELGNIIRDFRKEAERLGNDPGLMELIDRLEKLEQE